MIDIPEARDAPSELATGAQYFLTTGYRAITIMPMMRGGDAIGALSVVRAAPGALSDKQIAVLRTFVDQAVIAIENTRRSTNYVNAAAADGHRRCSKSLAARHSTANRSRRSH
jgi:GAF domain-containing protein